MGITSKLWKYLGRIQNIRECVKARDMIYRSECVTGSDFGKTLDKHGVYYSIQPLTLKCPHCFLSYFPSAGLVYKKMLNDTKCVKWCSFLFLTEYCFICISSKPSEMHSISNRSHDIKSFHGMIWYHGTDLIWWDGFDMIGYDVTWHHTICRNIAWYVDLALSNTRQLYSLKLPMA